jgi:hypothetical protein
MVRKIKKGTKTQFLSRSRKTNNCAFFGFITIQNYVLFVFTLHHLIKSYVFCGFSKTVFFRFLVCASLIKKQVKVNFSIFLTQFVLLYYIPFSLKQLKKSGKAYSIPWHITFIKAYKKFIMLMKAQIKGRVERSFELKIVGEFLEILTKKNLDSRILVTRREFYTNLSVSKHNLHLL